MLPDSADVLTACGLIFAFIISVVAALHLWTEFYATLIIIGTVLGIIGAIVAVCFITRGVLHITRRIPEPRSRSESRSEPIYSSRPIEREDPRERELRRRIEEEFDRSTEDLV